jgi:hypothetical protein
VFSIECVLYDSLLASMLADGGEYGGLRGAGFKVRVSTFCTLCSLYNVFSIQCVLYRKHQVVSSVLLRFNAKFVLIRNKKKSLDWFKKVT